MNNYIAYFIVYLRILYQAYLTIYQAYLIDWIYIAINNHKIYWVHSEEDDRLNNPEHPVSTGKNKRVLTTETCIPLKSALTDIYLCTYLKAPLAFLNKIGRELLFNWINFLI
jgi:hypothetical protein